MSILLAVYVVGWNKSLEATLVGGEYSRPYYNTEKNELSEWGDSFLNKKKVK